MRRETASSRVPSARGTGISSVEKASAPASVSEHYQVLLEIGRTLTGVLNDDELYASIYRETARVIEADGFYISLYDSGSDEATVLFWADVGKECRAQIVYPGSESEVIRAGVAECSENAPTVKDLLRPADEDMCRSKAVKQSPA